LRLKKYSEKGKEVVVAEKEMQKSIQPRDKVSAMAIAISDSTKLLFNKPLPAFSTH
jgi:hypothetical protein